MSMTIVATGKMYNGTVYPYKDGERNVYRGRLNFRDRGTGEWHWIDVVCWKDFGDKGGLVAWLEEHFNKDNGPKTSGGQPVEIVGTLRQKTSKFTAKINIKKNGKVQVMEAPGTEHETYELVIESADFLPTEEKRSTSKSEVIDFDDADMDDDFEIVGADEVASDDETSADDAPVADKKAPKGKKPDKAKPVEEEEDDFFEDN